MEEPGMEITRELLKEKFKEYNRLYFDGKLRAPGFSVIRYRQIADRLGIEIVADPALHGPFKQRRVI